MSRYASVLRRLSAMALAALLSCCAVGPNYHRPETPRPERWSGSAVVPAVEAVPGDASLAQWWRLFQDPQLDQLIESALKDNLDVQIAAARIAESRAQRDVVAGAALPTVGGNAQYTRYRLPGAITRLPGELLAPVDPTLASSVRIPSYLNLYQLGFDASWEIDLFGGTRRAIQAAEASTQAAIAAQRGVVVSTLAEVGKDYLALRATQQRLAIARHTLDTEQLLLELTQSRHAAGLASDLDVQQAQAQLEASRANLPALQAQVLQSIHALAVLMDRLPEDLETQLSGTAPLPPVPPSIPIELPSELLQSRPDIQQAERTLAAATAQVGVAEAQRFPSLSLTAATSLVSTQLNQLVHHDSWTWNAGGSLTAPIFEGGRLAANQRAAEAALQQTELQYRQAVLQAFRETEDALQNYGAASERLTALQTAARAQHLALDRATQLYRAGLGSYIDVLDADRTTANSDDQIALAQQDQATALVAIYKALGGGWQQVP
jgi:NodT family efflux transporter outer membrane factor (OMF) lipoprotein